MQFQRVGVQTGNLQKGLYGLVRLFVEQKIQAPEIRRRQRARFLHHLTDIDARGQPAQCEKHGKCQ